MAWLMLLYRTSVRAVPADAVRPGLNVLFALLTGCGVLIGYLALRSVLLAPGHVLPKEVHYFNAGNQLADTGRYAEACEKYAKAAEINPRLWEAHGSWGDALLKMRRPAEACEKYAKTVEINPRFSKAYLNWACALLEMGRPAEACEKCAKAAEINPRAWEAYASWGLALANMGKQAEAEEKWKTAVELNPELKPQIEEVRKQLLRKE